MTDSVENKEKIILIYFIRFYHITNIYRNKLKPSIQNEND